MGARGPAPKQENRQRSAPPAGAAGLVLASSGSGELSDIPPCPKSPGSRKVLAFCDEAWTAFWTSPLASLVLASDMPALRRLWLLYEERERAHRAYAAERSTTGSMEQLVVNPFAREIQSLDARIEKLEAQFGLTPASRMRLGISVGEAKRSLDSVAAAAMAEEPDDVEWPDEDEDPRVLAG